MSTAASQDAPAAGGRRWPFWAGVVTAGVAAGVALQLAGAAWFVQRREGTMLVTGRALTNGLAATLPTAALAALLLVLVFDRTGRRLVGVVVALLGLASAWFCARATAPDDFDTPLTRGTGGDAVHAGAWAQYLVAAGVLTVAGLVMALLPGSPRARARRAGQDDAWAVLDRGEDPTLG